jgi:hypothetical protein
MPFLANRGFLLGTLPCYSGHVARESSINDLGSFIAYLIPGAVVILGLSEFSTTLQEWLATAADSAPTIGGFLYLTIASLTAGMTVSAVRWTVVDTVHRWSGLRPPRLDFSKLGENVEAFEMLIQAHYRHYLFYSNMFIATAVIYICHRLKSGGFTHLSWLDLAFVAIEAIFFAASRDTLKKYFDRSGQLLAAPDAM